MSAVSRRSQATYRQPVNDVRDDQLTDPLRHVLQGEKKTI